MDLVHKYHKGDCHSGKTPIGSDSLWNEHRPCAEATGSGLEAAVLGWSPQKWVEEAAEGFCFPLGCLLWTLQVF
ncbi:hypothetical protein I79_022807 [Cricetulus griseus]|uniref:Uncharacterized protein n=1 Tax=Cricetulus griseus TaxID=10029 RepID=G3IGC3_CRIGR|nr:hypothetical protein I79_022807 [Cricetulus griseus]